MARTETKPRNGQAASRVVCLGMYGGPVVVYAVDRLWRFIAGRLTRDGINGVPESAGCPGGYPENAWTRPDLLLAQTCGWPFATRLRDSTRLVATPCYDAPGCIGPNYRSWLVAQRDDARGDVGAFRGARLAINDRGSMSGYVVWRLLLDDSPEEYFASIIDSGSHLSSMAAVAAGTADIAAIDCVTFALARRDRALDTDTLKIVAAGPSLPGLPLITAADNGDELVESLRRALAAAAADPDLARVRERLMLRDFAFLDGAVYDRVRESVFARAGE